MSFRSLSLTMILFLSSPSRATQIDPTLGQEIVSHLREAIHEDTTSLRVEYKSIVGEDTFLRVDEIFTNGTELDEGELIEFKMRDKQVSSGVNGTFTFYGKTIQFRNGDLKTAIKLRSRFYLEMMNDGSVNLSPVMMENAYLEIKIKNPNTEFKGVVNKYRILIHHEDLLRLFRADPKEDDFQDTLQIIEENTKDHPGNFVNQALIPIFFNAIRHLTALEPNFIKPELGIYYERTAYQFAEAAYISQHSHTNHGQVEYQFTVDRNVRGYFLKSEFPEGFEFLDYFRNGLKSIKHYDYPEHSFVIESKVPVKVGRLGKRERSKVHKFFNREFIKGLRKHALRSGVFSCDGGKAACLRRLAQ